MFRLSKKIEYSVLALQYMANKGDKLVTAKEMSERLNISFEFLSKVLQKLMKKGLVESYQGIKGGYQLTKPAEKIAINDVIIALDETPAIVECLKSGVNTDETCGRVDDCTLRDPMIEIQKQINKIFRKTTIAGLNGKSINEFHKGI